MDQAVTIEQPVAIGTADIGSRVVFFSLFFLSGFCSLLYQVVWVRLAFAHFGVITPVLSLVLSVFMLGLGLGSVLGGIWGERFSRRLNISLAYFYGAAELIIGIGAFVVPVLFQVGEGFLLSAGEATSTGYLFGSAIVVIVAVLPWCIMMGATFPLMMAFIRQFDPTNQASFSFLHLANVLGAMAGTALTALVLVELFGFRAASFMAAMINFSIAAVGFALARTHRFELAQPAEWQAQAPRRADGQTSNPWLEVILLTTGMTSLAMEVVWTRAFTFVLKTTIYSFAMILTTYLLATWIGSHLYRRSLKHNRVISVERLLGLLCLFALLPIVVNDPRVSQNIAAILWSIVPFCLALGYLTPRLIDEYSLGNPASAGRSYAVNIAGGILGPLLAAYILLPTIGTRAALLALSIPLFVLFIWAPTRVGPSRRPRPMIIIAYLALFAFSTFVSRDYEDGSLFERPNEIRRDHVATATAFGQGMNKRLLVNGVGMTRLTPITKVMARWQ